MGEQVCLTSEERACLVAALSSQYRSLHREVWDIEHFGDRKLAAEPRSRLKVLTQLLEKLGCSAQMAMEPITGDEAAHPKGGR